MKSYRIIVTAMLGALLLYLLFWRWQVSAVRFFDADEFSYMHWTAAVARGDHPYTDFFTYFTPGFMWAFAPIFWVAGKSAQVFVVGRVFAFVIFLGILSAVSYLFGMTRGWKWALLPAIILSFLPMPYDKFLEIRPDNLSMLLALVGVVCEVRALREGKNSWWLTTGLLFTASLFVLVKSVPIVGVGAAMALISVWVSPKRTRGFFAFLAGLLGPWVIFFGWYALTGNFHIVWYSLTRLSFEVYRISSQYVMVADLFFFPNASFYGGNGHTITVGLLTNHTLWLVAIAAGAYRLVTPIRKGDMPATLTELLVGGIFFVSIYFYIKVFPLKHSQYLIPIAVFVSYYASDAIAACFDWIARIGGQASLLIIILGWTYLLVGVTHAVNTPKLTNTNTRQLAELTALTRAVPGNARVVDLEGRMVFWQDAYPICCLSFDEFLPYVSEPPAPLALYLPLHPVDYIYDGDSGRLGQLHSENLAYIKAHFTPVPGFGDRLWQRK